MKSWNELSMAEKADIVKLAIDGGVYDLDTIRSGYNEFAEGGEISDKEYIDTMEKVAEENNPIWNQQRIAEGLHPLTVDEEYLRILNDNTYNYRGYYDKYPQSKANADTHWTDEFKTVYHPTFSNESIYSGQKSQYNPNGRVGGHWLTDDLFVPAPWQLFNNHAEGGKIHIDPSKKGTFTAAASRHGKSVQAFASQVLAHKENYSPAMVKKANFARNFGGKKKSYGGYMEGGIYDIDVEELNRLINNGYEIELL